MRLKQTGLSTLCLSLTLTACGSGNVTQQTQSEFPDARSARCLNLQHQTAVDNDRRTSQREDFESRAASSPADLGRINASFVRTIPLEDLPTPAEASLTHVSFAHYPYTANSTLYSNMPIREGETVEFALSRWERDVLAATDGEGSARRPEEDAEAQQTRQRILQGERPVIGIQLEGELGRLADFLSQFPQDDLYWVALVDEDYPNLPQPPPDPASEMIMIAACDSYDQ